MWNDVLEKEWEKRPLPDSHAHLLTYSTGGKFQHGERIFQFLVLLILEK